MGHLRRYGTDFAVVVFFPNGSADDPRYLPSSTIGRDWWQRRRLRPRFAASYLPKHRQFIMPVPSRNRGLLGFGNLARLCLRLDQLFRKREGLARYDF